MVVQLPWLMVVALDAVAWAGVSVVAGWWTSQSPAGGPDADGPVLRLRPFERGGRWYGSALHVRSWKHLLPDAGRAFGGRSKRRLPAGDRHGVAQFLSECRRAERTHWLILAATPLFAVWNPPGLLLAMVAFALGANGPCVVALRYNRARILASARFAAAS